MAPSLRRLRPPSGLRRLLTGDERLLAMAEDGPATVAATRFGLWLPAGGVLAAAGAASAVVVCDVEPAQPGWRRLDWDRVVKASWTGDGLHLIEGVVDSDGVVTDLPPVTLRLAEPRNLPAVVKARVEASIARWEQVRVPEGTGRIVARRRPGVDGLVWTARLDSGTPDSAQARAVLIDYLDRISQLTQEQLFPA